MPHPRSDDHPHLQRGDASPREHQGWWLLPREGSGGAGSGGGSCCSFPDPTASCPQANLANQTSPGAGKGQPAQNKGTWHQKPAGL